MVLDHWTLERQLTKELLESSSANRWEIFEQCYTRLYTELEWLNRLTDSGGAIIPPERLYGVWAKLIGTQPQRIFEVGSGKESILRAVKISVPSYPKIL
jgi:hypothetical protein